MSVDDILVTHVDTTRLRQALGNLISNAIRYSPRNSTVLLEAHQEGEDIVISVADTGIGLAPNDIAHVFNRFWRANQSRSRHSGAADAAWSSSNR